MDMLELFQKLGGRTTIVALLIIFYDKLRKDDRISTFFKVTEFEDFKNTFCEQLMEVHHFINEQEFDFENGILQNKKIDVLLIPILIKHLKDAMKQLKMDEQLISEVCDSFNNL